MAVKAGGFSARFQGGRPQGKDPDLVVGQARVTALGSGRAPGELLYTLDSGDVSGLFAVHGDDEKRLFHGSGQRVGAPVAHPSDRKSTRLNSSHQIISYAVFCLKKKQIQPVTVFRPP